MSLKVRCLLCSKILQCTREDTTSLLDHIREYHPEVTVLESADAMNHMVPQEEKEKRRSSKIEKESIARSSSGEEESVRRRSSTKPPERTTKDYNVRRQCRRTGRKRLYKTSIEKWRPGIGLIYCPKCGTKQRPIVKSHTEKISSSTLGAACILTCWPFCFFPCLFPSPAKEYLHCPVCDNFLGLYDKEKSCVRPNKQFVESEPEQRTDKSSFDQSLEKEESIEDLDERKSKRKSKEDKKKEKEEMKKMKDEDKRKKRDSKRKSSIEEEFYDA